jgi:hypothetical protein
LPHPAQINRQRTAAVNRGFSFAGSVLAFKLLLVIKD